jgi:hypothetical protein
VASGRPIASSPGPATPALDLESAAWVEGLLGSGPHRKVTVGEGKTPEAVAPVNGVTIRRVAARSRTRDPATPQPGTRRDLENSRLLSEANIRRIPWSRPFPGERTVTEPLLANPRQRPTFLTAGYAVGKLRADLQLRLPQKVASEVLFAQPCKSRQRVVAVCPASTFSDDVVWCFGLSPPARYWVLTEVDVDGNLESWAVWECTYRERSRDRCLQ